MSNLIFVSTQVGFPRILSPVRISGIDKGIFKMDNNTNSVVAQGLSEFRYDCLFNLIPVVNLIFYSYYLGLVDNSRALVCLDGTDHRILGPFDTIVGGPEQIN